MSDNPKSDNEVDWPSEMSFSGAIATMHPNGPTDFGIGKNIAGFSDSIGGCNMDFKATAKRGYAYKADDARDIEYKCLMKATGIGSGHGFSISFCTGHHTGSNCCQGFAYMLTTEITDNPTHFHFRKETVHVQYEESPEGLWTHSKANFRINGAGKFVGLGACRYNKPSTGGTSPQDDTVILEAWFNPDPDNDPSDWTMLKRIEDKPGKHWTGSANKCNGDSDQIGPWSNAQNRMKTNSTSGTIQFKCVTLREIDAFGTFEEPPPPPDPCPTGQHRDNNGNCVADSPGGGGGGGGSGGGGTPPPPSYVFEYKFGTHGSGNGQFLNPHDVSFDAAGNCFVCDRDRSDVQKFTHTGTYISKFGGPGSGNGQFNVPYAIQHTPDFANIYVMDRDNNRVQKLDSAGTYVSQITTANGKALNAPEDICFDGLGHFYICDTGNNRVVEFDATTHAFIREWGSKGSQNGQFDHPHSMDMGLDGNVYINSGNQAYIQVFTPAGVFIRKFSKAGNNDGELLTFLEHLDIDIFGRLHIINNNARPIVSVFDCATGAFLTKYGSPEHEGGADGQFREPEHVTTDSTGKPFVVDSSNFRIQVFSVVNPPPPPDPGGGGDGGGGGTPSEPSKVKGIFTLKRDINSLRTDACEGSGGGGGAGGLAKFYSVTADSDLILSNSSSNNNRTRLVQKLNTSSLFIGKTIKQVDIWLKKVSTPGATPTIKAKIWDSNGNVVYTSTTSIAPNALTTSFVLTSFSFSSNTHVCALGDRIGLEWTGTSSSAYVVAAYSTTEQTGSVSSLVHQFEGTTWVSFSDRNFSADIWE